MPPGAQDLPVMRSRNLAIVFTSIVGYAERIGRQTYEQTQRMLAVHADLLEPVFKDYGGRRIKVIGGTFLVAFELPTQALRCAAAVQQAVAAFNSRAPAAERLEVRAGINLGEVRLEHGDVFGDAVNVAARVEAQGAAGEVLFIEAVWLSMNRAEVRKAELGPRMLRGVPEPVRLFRLEGLAAPLAPLNERSFSAPLRVAFGAGLATVLAVAAALLHAGARP
jgi:adenylate cyclase